MTVHLGWDSVALVGFLAALMFWLGAVTEYVWHALIHRH